MATTIPANDKTNPQQSRTGDSGCETLFVDEYIDGILDPIKEMLGPVRDGGHIVANTTPGCWGPMITPAIRGGHEVTRPVAVAGADVGDAIAIRIKEITVTSLATASGNDRTMEGRFQGDPYCAAVCPQCGTSHPETVIKGIGPESVRCTNCGADATPFTFANGYTIVFDANRTLGVTLPQEAAEKMALDARKFAALPDGSVQNPILTFAPHDLVGIVARLRPFLGQLGTTPAVAMPDSHNAGDFGAFLVGAPHEFALTEEQLKLRTDGHMDIDVVRAGAVLICPVKVPGGGVYLGDMHALQGDGEIAGHTCDVAGTVTLQVSIIKDLDIDGPILLPLVDDLPFLARPLTIEEKAQAATLAQSYGLHTLEQSAPISVIGTAADLNSATENGLQRASDLLSMSLPEVKNRATMTGAIEIGRHPGVVQITLCAPLENLERAGLLPIVSDYYGIKC
ncbi:Acetamidase/Formamidase family protein [Symmachiella macrocystis]|uniref:Acetamidase/Formamidase family protein n=1 Tax=Symmachiella macrocystis TaxID=2527985 RepID=A0A5C6AX29_9PLAN|nr:acetamidase/formamidase family protein [Symmachiella macrocystis]TWU04188.1 Acetamidase/Formamidase family protein [Symmachiella macrocystis]